MPLVSWFDEFKEQERRHAVVIPAGVVLGARFDGKAFHTFTRQFARPYDLRFMDAMDRAGEAVVREMGALFGYVQSDEISVFMTDLTGDRSELPLGGRVEKILSIGASVASMTLYKTLLGAVPGLRGLPVFDGRIAFVSSDVATVADYVTWRRMDAHRNAVSAAAECVVSRTGLRGVGIRDRARALEGTAYERLPEGFFHGRLLVWRAVERDGFNPLTGETVPVVRRELASVPAIKETTDEAVASAAARIGIQSHLATAAP